MTAHRFVLTVHKWLGIAGAVFLVVIATSGAGVVFETEIDRALNRSTSYVIPSGLPRPLAELAAGVRAARPGDEPVGVRLPESASDSVEFLMRSRLSVFVDPYSARLLGVRDRQRSVARYLHRLHTELVGGPVGQKIVDWADLVFLLLTLSGVVLWWPRKIVAVRRTASSKRITFDLHNAVGVYGWVVFLAIAAAGVLIGFERTTDPIVKRLNAFDPEPPALSSAASPGATPISIDAALDAARAALPGAVASNINVPVAPNAVYRVLMKFPEDRTPAGRSRAYIDRFSGKVLFVENTRTAPLGTRILNLKRSVHTGDVFGWPTRLLYFVVAIGIVLQVITGTLIWLNSRKRSAARPPHERTAVR